MIDKRREFIIELFVIFVVMLCLSACGSITANSDSEEKDNVVQYCIECADSNTTTISYSDKMFVPESSEVVITNDNAYEITVYLIEQNKGSSTTGDECFSKTIAPNESIVWND